MNLRELLAGLGEFLQLGELLPNEQGVCELVFDDQLEVRLHALDDSRVLLEAVLGEPPAEDHLAEDFFKRLLQRNLLHVQEGRESLSLHETSGEVILHRVLFLERLTAAQAAAALEHFLNTLESWSVFEDAPIQPTFPANHIIMP